MPSYRKINGKKGLAYKITVSTGSRDGKQERHYKTWVPKGLTEKQADKEIEKIAQQFENSIKYGYQPDNQQTFYEYANYVIDTKESEGAKPSTIQFYRNSLKRVDPYIGNIKVVDMRPQHLNKLYTSLRTTGSRLDKQKAVGKENLSKAVKATGMTRRAFAELAGIGGSTLAVACRREPVRPAKAEAIAKALKKPLKALFDIVDDSAPLSNKTIQGYHRFIHIVLQQAEDELIVPYNAASKVKAPAGKAKTPNYFQPAQITAILDALDTLDDKDEKWKVITHLLIVTGCRRGEIMGLTWDKVDFKNRRLEISESLYHKKGKTFLQPTKTGNTRYIGMPKETVDIMLDHRQHQIEQQMIMGDKWDNSLKYVFTQSDGKPMNPDSITGWLKKFSEDHDLPHINPHAFRHSVASVLIAEGTDIVTVSKQLGHSQTSTTSDIYAHVIEEAKTRATETIADVMLRRKRA